MLRILNGGKYLKAFKALIQLGNCRIQPTIRYSRDNQSTTEMCSRIDMQTHAGQMWVLIALVATW